MDLASYEPDHVAWYIFLSFRDKQPESPLRLEVPVFVNPGREFRPCARNHHHDERVPVFVNSGREFRASFPELNPPSFSVQLRPPGSPPPRISANPDHSRQNRRSPPPLPLSVLLHVLAPISRSARISTLAAMFRSSAKPQLHLLRSPLFSPASSSPSASPPLSTTAGNLLANPQFHDPIVTRLAAPDPAPDPVGGSASISLHQPEPDTSPPLNQN